MDINWAEFLLDFRVACYRGTVTGKPAKSLNEKLKLGDKPISYKDEVAGEVATSLAKFDSVNGIPISVGMGWKEGVVIR